MAEKILNTRIQLKYDSLENWASANTLLKSGEVAIAYLPPKGDGVAPDAIASGVLMKVGPGNFNALPWVSATAADVYAWAKQASLPVENIDVQGEGYVAGNVISSIKFEDGKIKYTTATVATSEGLSILTGRVDILEANSATKDELQAAVEAINIGNYYTKAEANAAFATPAEVIEEVNKALANVSDADAITNITTLVEYVNENAGDLSALITEVYGSAEMTGDSRIDTAIADSAQAKSDAAAAVSTANNANTTAEEAKELAEGAVTTANEAKTAAIDAQNSATASAAAAKTSEDNAKASEEAAASSAADALAAKGAAETAKSAAESAQGLAETAKADAETAKTAAETAQGKAETAQTAAEAAQAAAENSNTSATAIATEAKGTAENAASVAGEAKTAADKATEDVATLTEKVEKLTTDDIDGGSEVWVFNCGTASLVV